MHFCILIIFYVSISLSIYLIIEYFCKKCVIVLKWLFIKFVMMMQIYTIGALFVYQSSKIYDNLWISGANYRIKACLPVCHRDHKNRSHVTLEDLLVLQPQYIIIQGEGPCSGIQTNARPNAD